MQPPNAPQGRDFWRGQRVRLRAVEQADLDASAAGEEPDTELERYEDAISVPRSPEDERSALESLARQVGENDFVFCVVENSAGQTVGYINSFDCERRDGAFKYSIIIRQPFWGQGYGREAVQLLLRYFFRELRYQKCTALVYSFNERSIRFHEALGFRFEGRLRSMHYTNGQYYDELYFGVTAAEWDDLDPPVALGRHQARAEG